VDVAVSVSAASSCRCASVWPSAASRSKGSRRQGPSKSRHSASSRAARRTVRTVAAVARPGAPAKRAAHPFGRILELLLQPAAEGFVEQALRPRLGQHVEHGIDPRFDGTLAQEIGAEAVNRAHVRLLEPLNRIAEIRPHVAIAGTLPQTFELHAQPQLQLARRLFRERDRDDLLDARPPARQHVEHA
jgi:hypothetical protein